MLGNVALSALVPVAPLLEAAGQHTLRHRSDDGAPLPKRHKISTLKFMASKKLQASLDVETPYGKLGRDLKLGTGQSEMKIKCLCPFALMHHLSSGVPQFAEPLHDSLRGKRGRIIFYIDQVVPGNVLRADKGRSYQAVYWSILDMPDWIRFRAKSLGWFAFCYVPSSDLADNDINISVLMKSVLEAFWPKDGESFNFSRHGVCINVKQSMYRFVCDFACIMGDEKALKECFSLKGASGTKPCFCCSNIVGRTDDVVVGLCHVHSADLSGVIPHTPATFDVMMERLEVMATSGAARQEIEDAQQMFGIKREEGSIMQDPIHPRAGQAAERRLLGLDALHRGFGGHRPVRSQPITTMLQNLGHQCEGPGRVHIDNNMARLFVETSEKLLSESLCQRDRKAHPCLRWRYTLCCDCPWGLHRCGD